MTHEIRTILVSLALAAAACSPRPPVEAAADLQQMRGEQLARSACGTCHAIGPAGESLDVKAPPLRRLAARGYEIAGLNDVMTKGLIIGHPPMPALQFAQHDVDDLIAYVRAIQTKW